VSRLASTERTQAPSPALAPPPGNPRFPLFDSLRAIAVLAVLAFHVASITGEINRPTTGDVFAVLGDQGPIIFFAISGFLLYRPFARAHLLGTDPPSSRRYARRRALRILPAYWTALLAMAIFPGIVGVFSGYGWRYFLFLQAYSNHTIATGIPSAWTLCVEAAFYVALPLWALLVRAARRWSGASWGRSELAPLAALAAGGIAVQIAGSRLLVSNLVASSVLGQCTWLALGMALAVASVALAQGEWRRTPFVELIARHPGLLWLGALGSIAGLAAVLHPGGLLGIVVSLHTVQPFARTLGAIALTAMLATCLLVPAIFDAERPGVPQRVLRWPPLAYLGLISYGVFLYHLEVAEVLGLSSDPGHFSGHGLGLVQHVHTATTVILFVLTLAVSAAVATVSYRVVELPFLRRKET